MPPSIRNVLTGDVSRSLLLTKLLPLSFVAFFSTMIGAAILFEGAYDWRSDVISILISPSQNPKGYWLPSLGMTVAVILIWPFGGYLGLHLESIMPRVARFTAMAFSLSSLLILLSLGAPHVQPATGGYTLHELLARASAVVFAAAMFCCGAAGVRDSLPAGKGRRELSRPLAVAWMTLTLLPIAGALTLGLLVLLGQKADQAWAESFRQSFRNTWLWRLAFWEWVGTVGVYVFMAASVAFLPCGQQTFNRRREPSPVA